MIRFPYGAVFFFVFAFMTVIALADQNGGSASLPTTLTREDLDPVSFAQWVDGKESPVVREGNEIGPTTVMWTHNSQPRYNGVPSFGAGANLGPRHLRVGFTKPITVGSILTGGNCRVSVLKSSAEYPGDLADDKMWIKAERINEDRITTEGAGYILWTLPPGTTTRALRFTHEPRAIDKTYHGTLSGVVVLEARYMNASPQARVFASTNENKTGSINDERSDTWGAWDNWDEAAPPRPVTEQSPWVMLVWPVKIELTGLAALFGGFGAAEVQQYAGPADRNPRLAGESDWKTIKSFDQLSSWYPLQLPVQWLDFGKSVTTQAIRVRMTAVAPEGHPHLKGRTQDGRRVWLDELIAVRPMAGKTLASAIPAVVMTHEEHAPIPIKFTLSEPGFVTLVIDDASGHRVRNLVSQTPFPKGENTAWWDGLDDAGRDIDAAKHGLYHVPGAFVAPGTYKVHGLFLKGIDLSYEFPIYTAGNPAWYTADHTGGWLSNHTPPCATLFVPGDRTPGGKDLVFIGSHVSEGTDGLAWVNMEGRKVGGMHWVGGLWTGAQALARDSGAKADAKHIAYVGAIFQGELRLTAIVDKGEKSLFKTTFPKEEVKDDLGGIAVRDGVIVASLTRLNRIVSVDAASGKQTEEVAIDSPRGVAFDAGGKLLVISGTKVVRYQNGVPSVFIAKDLESPQQIAIDSAGFVYVSDHGASHQVKVFNHAGTLVRTVGKPGAPAAGAYEPLHMNHPTGITIDGTGRLWVAEKDEQPKRISVWSPSGELVNAFYGPAEYGGGGTLDHNDKTLFYYKGMTFKLDWEKGANKLTNVYWRPDDSGSEKIEDTGRMGAPQLPHYVDGRKYFSNTFNSNPTNGASLVTIWIEKNGIARPVATLGRANDWKMLREPAFKTLWPEGVNLAGDVWKNQAFCIWCDLNDNGMPDVDEIKIIKGASGGVTIMPDLSAVVSRIDGKATQFTPRFTSGGAPIFDIAAGKVLATDVQGPASSGGDQALVHPDGWTAFTAIPKPYNTHSLAGVFKGEPRWSYPDLWPGLHASHEAQVPDRPGMIIGTTRLLGGFITPKNSDAGPLWCVNSNMGCMYLFTEDGLFVAQLFRESRLGAAWAMPVGQRGMNLNDITLHDENFWPSITQTSDGEVYLVDGSRTSLVHVTGLETIHRLPESEVAVTAESLIKAHEFFNTVEAKRQAQEGVRPMRIALRTASPALDGKIGEWDSADWVTIDKRGTRANFNSHSMPYDVRAAAAVSGDRLFLVYRTGDAKLLENSGETPTALFKTGGALDFMLAADPAADAKRAAPAAGDMRLLVTQVKGKTAAMLYRAVVSGTADADRVPFSSPWRTVKFDKVEDVSDQVRLAGADGNFELSIPLATLRWKPESGKKYRGDIGILRGDTFHTMQRVYWSNKATTTTADVPSEAELTPALWGEFDLN